MPSSFSKNIAFFQKWEKSICQISFFISKQNRLKNRTHIFTMALSVFWHMEAFEQQ